MTKYSKIIAISIFCLTFFTAFSQQRFKAGLILGANLSQVDGDFLAGYNQPGLNAGLEVRTLINEKWDWSIELLFSQKGSNRANDEFPSGGIESIRLQTAEVPLLINYYDWKLRFSAGLAYHRLFQYKVQDATFADASELYDFRNNYFSVIVGATYQITERWGVNARWSKGTRFFESQNIGNFTDKTLAIRLLYSL